MDTPLSVARRSAPWLLLARRSAPWLLVTALVALALLALVVGGASDDLGSWRWMPARSA
jgi:hypothetical protein